MVAANGCRGYNELLLIFKQYKCIYTIFDQIRWSSQAHRLANNKNNFNHL
jgi:hypothetical protein